MLQPLYHSPHAPRKESHTPTAVGGGYFAHFLVKYWRFMYLLS